MPEDDLPAAGEPLGDEPVVGLAAGRGAVDAEVEIFAVERDDGLTRPFVEPIRRWAATAGSVDGHARRPPNPVDYRVCIGLRSRRLN
jgi:hypothetical protein